MLFNLFNLLTSEGGADANQQNTGNPLMTYLVMGGAIALIIVMMVFSRRAQKKKQDETNAMLDALAPGNKVKTIGGICGVVVEVCKEDNTFVLETGSEANGKSYIRFDKQSIYQTDAKAPTAPPVANENNEETVTETAPEAPVEEVFEETAPQAAPETTEAPAEAPAEAQAE